MKNIYLFFTLLTVNGALYAQTNILKGRVLLEGEPIENISVLNRNTKATVQTNAKGRFGIAADIDDQIVFFNENNEVESRWIYVKEYDLNNKEGIQIELTERAELLEELEIDHTVSTESLGLKNMTHQKPNPTNMDILALVGAVIKVFKKEKTKEIILDEQQRIDLLSYHFTESKLKELLGDDSINVQEFIYFAIADNQLIQILQEENKSRMELEMMEKAFQFLAKKGK